MEKIDYIFITGFGRSGTSFLSHLLSKCDGVNSFHEYIGNREFELLSWYLGKKYTIPYGTCEIGKDGIFKKILEKPSLDYLINTGFYITNSSNIELIPNNKKYDMTTFIKDLVSEKRKIGIYPILEEDWVDIGQWPEYQKAIKLF